jgi:hypothetical protein
MELNASESYSDCGLPLPPPIIIIIIIMWHKVRLLQMSEREKLPKLKTNSKLIKIQEEINGVNEELLEKDEMDVTHVNILIYAAATVMTQTRNKPSKGSKNRRNVKFWKIRMQKQISS